MVIHTRAQLLRQQRVQGKEVPALVTVVTLPHPHRHGRSKKKRSWT